VQVFKVSVRAILLLTIAATLVAQTTTDDASSNPSTSYDGPNVMGRGPIRVGMIGAESVPISVSFIAAATYDTLLGGFRTDANGNLAPGGGSYGVEGGFSVTGQKRFRRAMLGISYTGGYNYFRTVTGFSGTNQALNLAYGRQLSRRVEMNWTNTASITNRILGNPLNQLGLGVDLVSVPVNELFDTRIYFLQSQMNVGYNFNSRWQVQLGGNGGAIRRQANSLADANIYGGSASLMYRWSRNTTIGGGYNYTAFNFGRSFGESGIHGLSINFAQNIGRSWQVSASISGQTIRTIGVRRVALDPVIAALLGSGSGVEAFDSRVRIGGYGLSIGRTYRRTNFALRADRTVVPGNGLMLTSVVNSQSVSAIYNAARKWNIVLGANRSKMTEIAGNTFGAFDVWGTQVGVSRNLTNEVSLNGTVEYRSFSLADSPLDRRGTRYLVGLSYSPTSLPFGK
jgi:hypothetical protein